MRLRPDKQDANGVRGTRDRRVHNDKLNSHSPLFHGNMRVDSDSGVDSISPIKELISYLALGIIGDKVSDEKLEKIAASGIFDAAQVGLKLILDNKSYDFSSVLVADELKNGLIFLASSPDSGLYTLSSGGYMFSSNMLICGLKLASVVECGADSKILDFWPRKIAYVDLRLIKIDSEKGLLP